MPIRAQQVLTLFEQINRIPRCSKNEQAIAAWLRKWADDRSFANEQDEIGNVLIRVPATTGLEDAPVIALQGHMDMVCEKTSESTHNFETDPITIVADGEWIHAEDTTLGADNGIALAIALAFAEGDAPHPELEILITVDEETGLTGAKNLQPGWLTSRVLLNIDSEDEGVFTVGCAGGRDTIITLRTEQEALPENLEVCEVAVSGLQGGHSGVDIHLGRANANVLLVRTLLALGSRLDATVRLAGLRGGNAHNAIPREASAVIGFPSEARARVEAEVAAELDTFRSEYGALEPGLAVTLRSATDPSDVFTESSAGQILDLLAGLPHGVVRMSSEVPGLVETSTNLATVRAHNDAVEIKTSQRSSYTSRLAEIANRMEAIARLAGAEVKNESSYPPWEPHMESELLGRAVESYRGAFGKDPVVEVIHAGLECGVIGSKYPEMQMISFGPTIQNAHSPDERLFVPSLDRICVFMETLFGSYLEGTLES
ncbi:MAG TPA: aminoacyl-histidine dipeptidase [Spirochaetia bacterium]|nr:aminoacyl-histidine dipeptidase [Spirochaetia bacterium]